MKLKKMPKQLFLTGTSTDIGKTVVAAILMVGLQADYWKPVQSGTETITDTEWIREKTGLPENHFHQETYILQKPLSPHASAAMEEVQIDLDRFELPNVKAERHLVVEGAGGIMVPLNDQHFMLDLMKTLNIPILLVSPSSLGMINHTLLSLEQLRRHDLEVLGVVMNGPENSGNRTAVEKYGEVVVLAEIERLPKITPQILLQCYQTHFS